jgi:hypothetical protein
MGGADRQGTGIRLLCGPRDLVGDDFQIVYARCFTVRGVIVSVVIALFSFIGWKRQPRGP